MKWSLGMCTLSRREPDGFVTYSADWMGEQNGGGAAMESISPYGFRSRPRSPALNAEGDPIAAQAAMLVYCDEGAFPAQDPRDATTLPDEGEGGSLMYCRTPLGQNAFVMLAGGTGAVTVRPAGVETCTVAGQGELAVPVALMGTPLISLLNAINAAIQAATIVDPSNTLKSAVASLTSLVVQTAPAGAKSLRLAAS